MQADLRIQVSDPHIAHETFTVQELVDLAEMKLALGDRVRTFQGMHLI